MTMPLRALAYTSHAARPLTRTELDGILVDARSFNATVEVTGVLFHGQQRFVQYIEGPPEGMDAALARIHAARAHADIIVLSDHQVSRRELDRWHMGFCEPPDGVLQSMSQASWEEAAPITRDTWQRSEGLGLALYHWNLWLVAHKTGAMATVP